MADDSPELPEWERLLGAERHLQAIVSGAVLVGGTAAALHAGHRRSMDGDHVLTDLRGRFDEVLNELEAAAGWETSRVRRPVLILERLDGVMTGIRQLRRTRPLETEVVQGLRVPTLGEMARIKAWLFGRPSHSARLSGRGGASRATGLVRHRRGVQALRRYLPAAFGLVPPGRGRRAFGRALPTDAPEIDLRTYRGLVAPWDDWKHVAERGRHWAQVLAASLLGNGRADR